jgi:hypothetical protein
MIFSRIAILVPIDLLTILSILIEFQAFKHLITSTLDALILNV